MNVNLDRIVKKSDGIAYLCTSISTLILLFEIPISRYGAFIFVAVSCGIWCFSLCFFCILKNCIIEVLYCIFWEQEEQEYVEDRVKEIEMVVVRNDNEDCSICLEPCIKCVQLECGHYFHIRCINSWLQEQAPLATCPNCRDEIV